MNCQAVGESHSATKYLAPYVFKVAISNNRVINVENNLVTFKYKASKSNRLRTMTIHVFEFMRRFLQHVLPAGFMKVRYYGFLSPSSSIDLTTIKVMIKMSYGFDCDESVVEINTIPNMVCHKCGGLMIYQFSILPAF